MRSLPVLHLLHRHFYLLGPGAIAPQEAAVGQVGRVAPGQLAKAVLLHIALHGGQQLGLVGRAVAGRWRARAAQHAQRELHLERVGLSGQGSHVHGLQVGVLDGGVQLGGVLVFGLEAIADGAAHRLCADSDGLPGVRLCAVVPAACVEDGVRWVQLAFKGQDGCSSEFVGHGVNLSKTGVLNAKGQTFGAQV